MIGLAALLAACNARTGPSDDTGAPDAGPLSTNSLTITPAMATINVVDGAPTTQSYTVMATNSDGTTSDVTATAVLTVDSNFASVTGATLTSTGTAVGVTTVTASVGTQSSTAQLTVTAHNHRVDTGAVANAADLFGPTATLDPSSTRAPTIAYPAPDVIMPINIGEFEVDWKTTSLDDTFEVEVASTYATLDVFEAATPGWMEFTPAEWALVSSQATGVTIDVRSALSTAPGTIAQAMSQTVTLSDQPIAGGLYYWAAKSSDGANPAGIYRHDVATPGDAPEAYYTMAQTTDTTYPNGRCVACHALSRDGTKMVVTYDGGGGASQLLDVATQTTLATSPGNWDFATYSAMGDYLATSSHLGVLTLRDGSTGAIVPTATSTIPTPTGVLATHPDFSPNGDALTYVTYTGGTGYADYKFIGGSIVTQSFDDATQTFGTPTTILASTGDNNYYPSYSPDGQWIIFNRDLGNANSYNNPAAEVWVMPAAGGTPIQLISADITTGITDSWARWAPFQQTVGGEPMYWITFSSTRDFGVRLPTGGKPQIWMSAFFPDRAMAGTDPSGPAFRLPFQNITSDNHIAQWTDAVVPIQ